MYANATDFRESDQQSGGDGASVRLQESQTGSSWLSLVTNQMKHA